MNQFSLNNFPGNESDLERFVDKILVGVLCPVEGLSGECWNWAGSGNGRGYGRFNLRGKMKYPHRLSYEWINGPIPSGYTIDHLCNNKMCVNPSHLEAVSLRVNILRGNGLSARRARQTHCKRGHLFDETNTYLAKNGSRVCRRCHADNQIRRYHSKKESTRLGSLVWY